MIRRHRSTDDRGVSEVISVLLMVAVTIVLAAMVGTVLLDIVSEVEDNPLAGAAIEFEDEDDEIRVLYTVTQKNGTTLDVKVINDSTGDEIAGSPKTIPEVGDSVTFDTSDGLANGRSYTVRIVAKAPGGKEAVVYQKDGRL